MTTHIRNFVPPFLKPPISPIAPESVILITGGGSGIGQATAIIYAKRRMKLIIADLNEEAAQKTAELCKTLGASSALALKVDVTKENSVAAMMKATIDQYSQLDVLLLCAGLGGHHFFHDSPIEIYRRLMEVNYFGYLNCIKAAYPHLCEKTRRSPSSAPGLLIAITSLSGEIGLPYRSAYCASKFAVTGLLESLRAEMIINKNNQQGGGENTKPGDSKVSNGISPVKAGYFDISIICPPTVNTNLRKNSLTTENLKDQSLAATDKGISVEECARAVVDAGDRRLRKAFFPSKVWLAAYLRPLVPDLIDQFIVAKAKL